MPKDNKEGKEKWQAERLEQNEENQKAQDEWGEYAAENRTEGKVRQAPANKPARKKE